MRGADRIETRFRLRARRVDGPGAAVRARVVAGARSARSTGCRLSGTRAALALVFGAALLVPAVLFVLGARRPARARRRLFGVEGWLAHANLAGAIPRLSVSVAALAVSLSMMVAIAVMIGSFRDTVVYWVGQTLQADLFIGPAARAAAGARQARSRPRSSRSSEQPPGGRRGRSRSGSVGRAVRRHADPARRGRLRRAARARHPAVQGAARRARGDAAARSAQDAVVVSEAFSLRHDVHAGDAIDAADAGRTAPFRVAAVYYDYTSDRGVVVMDRATFARYYGELRPDEPHRLPDGRRGREPSACATSCCGRSASGTACSSTRTDRCAPRCCASSTARSRSRTRSKLIAIVVAILGVAGTLLTLVLERGASWRSLRLVGADRAQVRKMVVIEAALIGLASARRSGSSSGSCSRCPDLRDQRPELRLDDPVPPAVAVPRCSRRC